MSDFKPECPECHIKLDHLIKFEAFENRYKFFADCQIFQSESESDNITFECPECRRTLFYSEEEARDFLEGSK